MRKKLINKIEELYEVGSMNYKAKNELIDLINEPKSDEEIFDEQVYDSLIKDGY